MGFPRVRVTPKFANSDKEGGSKHLSKIPSWGGCGSSRVPGSGSQGPEVGVRWPEDVAPHYALLRMLRARGPEKLSSPLTSGSAAIYPYDS